MLRRLITLTAIACSLASCGVTSRYRLDLFVSSAEEQKKVNVEQTEFVKAAVLSDPFQEHKYSPGSGNVAVVTVGTRWNPQDTERFRLFGFDEYWRCRLYLQLPEPLEAGRIGLDGKSFLQLMGKYDLSAEEKIFLPDSGFCSVDSVNSKNVFLSIGGQYLNNSREPLAFTGQFKIKRVD